MFEVGLCFVSKADEYKGKIPKSLYSSGCAIFYFLF
jgi:hypothetical protein